MGSYIGALRGPGHDTFVLSMAILTSVCIPIIAALHVRNYRRAKAARQP